MEVRIGQIYKHNSKEVIVMVTGIEIGFGEKIIYAGNHKQYPEEIFLSRYTLIG